MKLISTGVKYAALVIGVLAAAYTYLTTIDFSYLAPRLEQYVKNETGLDIKIGGPIGFASPTYVPGVYAEDVTLAPQQSSDVASVHVGRFEIRINPLFLFGLDGTIHITEFAVRDAEFTLAVGQRQASFVDFLDAARSLLATVPTYYGEPVVDRVRFRDGELVYEASGSRPERRVSFEDLRLTGRGDDAGLEFVGQLGGESYVLSGTLDSYRDVLNGGASTLELTGALGTLFVSLSGDLVNLSTLNLDLTYKLLGPDLTPLANILGFASVQPHHGLSLTGDLNGNLGEAFQSQLRGQVGRGALEGEVILDLRVRPILTASFQSPEFDLTPFVPAERPELSYAALISENRFDRQWIETLDWTVDLSAQTVRLGDSLFGPATVFSALSDGRLELELHQSMADEGSVSAMVTFDWRQSGAFSLITKARVTETAALLAGLGFETTFDPPVHFAALLKAEGLSRLDLLRSAEGQFNVVLDQGRIGQASIDTLSEWLGAKLIGGDGRSGATINCMIGRVDVSEGSALSEALLVDTASEFATGSGSVDFKKETIDVALRSRPKDPRALDRAIDVAIAGPLWAPVIVEEQQDVARGLSSPLALFATRESSAEALPLFGEDLPRENNCLGPLIGS